jgi:hypothetical protein
MAAVEMTIEAHNKLWESMSQCVIVLDYVDDYLAASMPQGKGEKLKEIIEGIAELREEACREAEKMPLTISIVRRAVEAAASTSVSSVARLEEWSSNQDRLPRVAASAGRLSATAEAYCDVVKTEGLLDGNTITLSKALEAFLTGSHLAMSNRVRQYLSSECH